MSLEDEMELKDLLMQTLMENGCLAKIKAQLRASVFLALEEDANLSSQKPLLNNKVKSCLESLEGQLMFCIVKEFLEYFNLQSTMAVFDAESYLGICYQYKGRSKLSEELDLTVDSGGPLLQQIFHETLKKPKVLEVTLNISEEKSDEIPDISYSSENSVKTDSNLNGELGDAGINYNVNMHKDNEISSDSSSSFGGFNNYLKENGTNHSGHEGSVDVDLTNNVDHEGPDNLNKTFTTASSFTMKHSQENTIDNENNILGKQLYESQDKETLPSPISERIDEVITPVLKESKVSPERVKSPPKLDKYKSKNSLNSLSDLPPLNMNKSRTGKILPSLYSKELREKSNS